MDLISGKTESTQGRVFLYDTDITNLEEHRIARAASGANSRFERVQGTPVRRNLEVAELPQPRVLANLGFASRGRRMRASTRCWNSPASPRTPDALAANLSHGQTQWLELGLLIVQNPKAAAARRARPPGMTQAETHRNVADHQRAEGRHTILVVEHDMAFVARSPADHRHDISARSWRTAT